SLPAPIGREPCCICGLCCLRSSDLFHILNEVCDQMTLVGWREIPLNKHLRRGFCSISHLFSYLLPRHFHFLLCKKRSVFIDFTYEPCTFLQQFRFLSFALSSK